MKAWGGGIRALHCVHNFGDDSGVSRLGGRPEPRLVEVELSEQFGASRATVRSALVEMANEGLVERVQNHVARVRAVSPAEAIEGSQVRMVVEGRCAANAAERITRADQGAQGPEHRSMR